MRWTDVVAAYPNQWVVVEAHATHVEVVDAPVFARGSAIDLAVPTPIDAWDDDETSDGVIADAIADATVVADVPRTGWTFRRVLDEVTVLELCADGCAALHASRQHARTRSGREVVFIHTSYPTLSFEQRAIPRRRRPSERQRAVR